MYFNLFSRSSFRVARSFMLYWYREAVYSSVPSTGMWHIYFVFLLTWLTTFCQSFIYNLWFIMMTRDLLYSTCVQCLIYVLCHVFYLFLCVLFVVIGFIWLFHLFKRIYDPKPSCGLFLFTPKTDYILTPFSK